VIVALLLSCFLISVFEFSIHLFQWKWLLEHPNSYGLQIGFDILLLFIISCIAGFIRVRQKKRLLSKDELNFVLGIMLPIVGVFIGILIGLFQLLGGPPPTK
jgi:hypothetical protein